MKVFLYGAGALGREVYEWQRLVADADADVPLAFVDDDRHGTKIETSDGPVAVLAPEDVPDHALVLLTIANPRARDAACFVMLAKACQIMSCTMTGALVARTASFGRGTIMLPHSVVSAGARIGEGLVANCHSSIGHDVTLGDFVTLSSHVDICGHAQIGNRVTIGSGARILPAVKVGDDAVIGAGAVVVRDVPARATVFGNPAR